jgi:hypothetical protein
MEWTFKYALWLFTSYHFHRLLAHALVIQRMEMQTIVGGGADKSLARPGMKQATVTKLGIYST